MKRSIIMFLLVATALTVGAQEPSISNFEPGQLDSRFKKLEKLYAKGKLESLIGKANKMKSNDGSAPEPDYMIALASHMLAINETSPTKRDRYMTKTVSAWSKAVKKDKSRSLVLRDTLLSNSIRELNTEAALSYYDNGRKTKAKTFVKRLAKVYGDTLDFYYALYPLAAPTPEVVVEPVEPVMAVATKRTATEIGRPATFPSRTDMIATATKYMGSPYVWGGNTPKGFDCSGFVKFVYAEYGYDLFRTSQQMSKVGTRVKMDEIQEGDLAFFGTKDKNGRHTVKHVGMIANADPKNPMLIHSTGGGVQIDSLKPNTYWNKKLLFVNNVIEEQGSKSSSRSLYGQK